MKVLVDAFHFMADERGSADLVLTLVNVLGSMHWAKQLLPQSSVAFSCLGWLHFYKHK